MACPAVISGSHFLGQTLASVDCHARAIGAYGYGALAQPGSAPSLVLTGLLTVFVALFGIRLLLGRQLATRDVVGDVLKIGIVLTLATSWPAWRVLGYDLIIHGPGEIARSIGLAAGLPGARGDMVARLDRADEALAALNLWGAGRLRGVAQGDWFQLGLARNAFLLGALVPVALMRLASGILLALAPLMAGLLLFGMTRGLFAGWLRGLALCFLGSAALAVVLGVELAILEPWLQDALQRRIGGEELLGLPPEALALTAGFMLVSIGILLVAARIAFHPALARVMARGAWDRPDLAGSGATSAPASAVLAGDERVLHARSVATSIAESLRREERFDRVPGAAQAAMAGAGAARGSADNARGGSDDMLGASWRRPVARATAASRRRDQTP